VPRRLRGGNLGAVFGRHHAPYPDDPVCLRRETGVRPVEGFSAAIGSTIIHDPSFFSEL
jgi:hypothetical protein